MLFGVSQPLGHFGGPGDTSAQLVDLAAAIGSGGGVDVAADLDQKACRGSGITAAVEAGTEGLGWRWSADSRFAVPVYGQPDTAAIAKPVDIGVVRASHVEEKLTLLGHAGVVTTGQYRLPGMAVPRPGGCGGDVRTAGASVNPRPLVEHTVEPAPARRVGIRAFLAVCWSWRVEPAVSAALGWYIVVTIMKFS